MPDNIELLNQKLTPKNPASLAELCFQFSGRGNMEHLGVNFVGFVVLRTGKLRSQGLHTFVKYPTHPLDF